MKKLGILTYHYSINEGAMLQAYALQEVCQKLFSDVRVELINYESLSAKKRDLYNCFNQPLSLKSIIARLRRWQKLSFFKEKNFSLGKKRLVSDDYEKAIQFVNEQNYDVIIVGSDEVWKVRNKKDMARKFPNIYWLNNRIKAKKYSYAASANKTKYKQLDEKTRDFMRESLSSYSLISIRDRHTHNLILECLPETNRVFKVLDPTLLIDKFDSRLIDDKLRKKGFDFDKPTVVLNLEVAEVSRATARFFKERNWQTIAVTAYCPYADINLIDVLDPFEWISIIDRCQFSVTERFHGTIFSLRQQIPFIAIDRNQVFNPDKISKIESLLEEFKLENHLFRYSPQTFSEVDLHKKLDSVQKNTDFSHLDELIDSYRQQSIEYLQKIGTKL